MARACYMSVPQTGAGKTDDIVVEVCEGGRLFVYRGHVTPARLARFFAAYGGGHTMEIFTVEIFFIGLLRLIREFLSEQKMIYRIL